MEPEAGDPGIARAGAAVAARRRELDIKQRYLAKFKIINAGALIAFEKGRSWPRERTRAKLEEILQWPAGTIATIRYGGQAPGAVPEPPADAGTASLIAGTVEVAMTTLGAAVESLPGDDDPDFAGRATVILSELRKLEAVVARAAQHSRGTQPIRRKPSAHASTTIPAKTSVPPGRTGTTIPTSPTSTSSAARA